MAPLHSFFHTFSYTFALYPHYIPVNTCYLSSTLILVMTVPLSHSIPSALYNYLLRVFSLWHPPVDSAAQYALKSVPIAAQNLSDWPYTCTCPHTNMHTQPIQAVNYT